jgi:MFS transporter, DHA1 family, tetracycline resistance protein
MIDLKTIRNISSPLVVIFIDSTVSSLAIPVLVILMSAQGNFLPPDTSLQRRLFYLSLVLMLKPLFTLIGCNYIGTLSDIIKRRYTLLITSSGLTLSLFFVGYSISSRSIILLCIARCFMGIFGGTIAVAMASVVDRVSNRERSRAIAITNYSSILGIIIGPLLGGFLSNRKISPDFTPELPFYLAGVMSAFSIIWISMGFKESFGSKKARTWQLSELYLPFIRAFQHKKTRLLFPQLICFITGITLYIMAVWFYMSDLAHLDSTTLGIFMAISGAVGLISTLFIITPLTHKYCTEKIMTISLICIGVCYLIQGIFVNMIAIWIIMIPTSIFEHLIATCAYANSSHAVGKHHQGWAMGMTAGSFSLGWLFASLGSNFITRIGIQNIFFISMGFVFLSSVIMMIHRRQFHPAKLEEEIESSG